MQGEEGGLSLTTKARSADAAVKGRPVNFCSGFRPSKDPNVIEDLDGTYEMVHLLPGPSVEQGMCPWAFVCLLGLVLFVQVCYGKRSA